MTVYIDPLTGDNSRRGESPETALRDLEPLTRGILPPGTVVRLRAGACHQGGFTLTAAGEMCIRDRWYPTRPPSI